MLTIVKLKRKLEHKGHVYIQPLRPSVFLKLVKFLRNNNNLYEDVTIVPRNILNYLISSPENLDADSFNNDSAK